MAMHRSHMGRGHGPCPNTVPCPVSSRRGISTLEPIPTHAAQPENRSHHAETTCARSGGRSWMGHAAHGKAFGGCPVGRARSGHPVLAWPAMQGCNLLSLSLSLVSLAHPLTAFTASSGEEIGAWLCMDQQGPRSGCQLIVHVGGDAGCQSPG